jgi:hypothetical protein
MSMFDRDLADWTSRVFRAAHHEGAHVRPDLADAAPILGFYAVTHPLRPGAALSAWLVGDSVEEALAAATLTAFRTYMTQRRNGVCHSEAFAAAAATHVCAPKVTVEDFRCPVLRTGDVVTVSSCSCGRSSRRVDHYNFSGD